MPNIFYYTNASGEEMGKWPGTSVWTPDGPRKVGQKTLGKVIVKEKNIFFKNGQGFYQFNPEDQSTQDIPMDELPQCMETQDHRRRKPPVIVSFGGSYFLHRLLTEIGYFQVLEGISYARKDRLHSMLQYYVLSNRSKRHAETWYMHNFTKYLYPNANLASQRISDFLAAIGTAENTTAFLKKHIAYVLDATDKEKCVLIDSTGCPNKCSLYVTEWSVHEGEASIAFRVIVVVQKSTGFPLYFKVIPGHMVDISTVMYVVKMMKKYGCDVDYVLGDAGYCCPAVMERMIWAGLDFMTRLCPHYSIFKNTVRDHLDELKCPENLVDYHGRKVYVLKSRQVIAHNKKSKEPVEGYVYLCLDLQAHHSKIDHLMNSKEYLKMTNEEFLAACEKLGLFAIVTTKDLTASEVLPEYYIRQGIEQYFDFAKNYGRFIPVRCHTMETMNGHMLLAFIATFIICLVEYRLNHVDTRYVSVRDSMRDAAVIHKGGDAILVEVQDGEAEMTIEQDVLMDIFEESAGELFESLQYQMADVFDDEIIPEPVVETKSLYEAYGLHSPYYVELKNGHVNPVLREGDVDECTKILAFARKPTITDEEIKAKREASKQKKLAKTAAEQGYQLTEQDSSKQQDTPTSENDSSPKRGPGRPKGVKNKKTREREQQAAEAALKEAANAQVTTGDVQAETETVPQKRRRGRPKGAKNKKTREREQQAALKEAANAQVTTGDVQAETETVPQKRGRGRPKGAKNKKTREREQQAAEATHKETANAQVTTGDI